MFEASKKRPRDDIPCVPIGSPVWIVKSWREMPAGSKWNYGIEYDQKDYCVHGVFATLKAANAEARWTRDCELEIEDEEDIEFVRYSGREYKYVKMNMSYDNWDTWVPKNPTEQMLKNAIDSNGYL